MISSGLIIAASVQYVQDIGKNRMPPLALIGLAHRLGPLREARPLYPRAQAQHRRADYQPHRLLYEVQFLSISSPTLTQPDPWTKSAGVA